MIHAPSIERLAVVGYTYRDAGSDVRDAAKSGAEPLAEFVRQASHAGLEGVVELATCHRVELVLSATEPAYAAGLARGWLEDRSRRVSIDVPSPRVHVGEEAARRVMRLAAGLESAVVGEREIAGQVRQAFESARRAGTCDTTLNGLAQCAADVARASARGASGLTRQGTFTLAASVLSGRVSKDAPVHLVGPGDIGRRTARALLDEGYTNVSLVGRRRPDVAVLGKRLSLVPFHDLSLLPTLAEKAGAVVLATGAAHALFDERIADARSDAMPPLLVVDLGQPPQFVLQHRSSRVEFVPLDELVARGTGAPPPDVTMAERAVESGLVSLRSWIGRRKHGELLARCDQVSHAFRDRVLAAWDETVLAGLGKVEKKRIQDAAHRLMVEQAEALFAEIAQFHEKAGDDA